MHLKLGFRNREAISQYTCGLDHYTVQFSCSPSYTSMHSRAFALLFNLQLLAVVYGSFEEEEKKKFMKLFKHKLLVLACHS